MKKITLIVACLFSLSMLGGCVGSSSLFDLIGGVFKSVTDKYTEAAANSEGPFICPEDMTSIEIQVAKSATGIDCIQPKVQPKLPVIIVEPTDPVKPSPNDAFEYGTWWGYFNGNRGTWYFSRNLIDYKVPFTVNVEGCGSFAVTENNGVRFESDAGAVVKQSDVPGRGTALVMPDSCRKRKAHFDLQGI